MLISALSVTSTVHPCQSPAWKMMHVEEGVIGRGSKACISHGHPKLKLPKETPVVQDSRLITWLQSLNFSGHKGFRLRKEAPMAQDRRDKTYLRNLNLSYLLALKLQWGSCQSSDYADIQFMDIHPVKHTLVLLYL
ncbi:hypothetical protein WAI453_004760 [Rhynchosporium graminicola]